ncbi:exodeoxyribonuclease VII large subunit [Agrilactobacillus fermenti]|uniref:exodeoxyribonuclease VII large subunit n=1 Tax=Agrilactobacillus fermenti TaxID=2586909 RepID=UPI003A5C1D9B
MTAEMPKYLTVSALTQYIKRKFDFDPYLDQVYLRGEISNFRLRPHNHQYFSLKDDGAKINAIMFKSAFEHVKFEPEVGMQVLVTGRISVYEPTGNYQIYINSMIPDGIGELYLAYEQLKKKLADEGLFSQEKRPLPRFPKRIAVITSPSGAVIRDIITTTRRRYPIAQLVLFPAVVQGDGAKESLVHRLRQVNTLGNFDTIIIGRGGGSIEDLWPFNEEPVVRAIAASEIPVVSSVGHETDTTLSDLAADVRAATPTAAAELATPVLQDELIRLQQQKLRLIQALQQAIKISHTQLVRLQQSYVFTNPKRLYENYLQRLDLAKQGLVRNLVQQLKTQQTHFADLTRRLHLYRPNRQIETAQQRIFEQKQRLLQAFQQYLQTRMTQMQNLAQSLDHLSPLKILGRGYSYVIDPVSGALIQSTENVQINQTIAVHMKDGIVSAKVTHIKKEHEHGEQKDI